MFHRLLYFHEREKGLQQTGGPFEIMWAVSTPGKGLERAMANKLFLGKVELFLGLSEHDLGKMLEIVSERSYRKGEVIFHIDDLGSTLFILKSGSVKIFLRDIAGREDILKVLYPGEVFGEMSLLDGQHRSATVAALERSTAIVIPRERFIDLIVEHPQIALNLLAHLSRRLRKTDEKIASLRFASAYGKVARVLLDIADNHGKKSNGCTLLDLRLSRQELAELAGMSRETFTRTLFEFQKNGSIRIDDRRIAILDETALRRETL
jgi:CRP/FNR family cyclic AMP-dependent transcriptional regulator